MAKSIGKRMQFCMMLMALFAAPALSARGSSRQAGHSNTEIPAQAAQSNAETPAQAAAPKSATQDPNYVIGPQDVLDISVWKEPELTRELPVRPDGKISIPLLSDVQAAGLTPTQLAAKVSTGPKEIRDEPSSDGDRDTDQQPTRLYTRRSRARGRVPPTAADDGLTSVIERWCV